MIDITRIKPKNVEAKKGIFANVIKPTSNVGYFAAIVAIDALGEGHVIATNPNDLYETELFDGTTLSDNIDGKLPELKPGVYKCQIKVHSFQCNHPQDPVEWDMTITLEDIEEIEIF